VRRLHLDSCHSSGAPFVLSRGEKDGLEAASLLGMTPSH
jgi:hypothetical protein